MRCLLIRAMLNNANYEFNTEIDLAINLDSVQD